MMSRRTMVALEGVNADCHKFDVFVMWPGEDKPSRAQIVAFQDLYSGKIQSWRVDHNPNKVAVMAAFVEEAMADIASAFHWSPADMN